MAETEIFLNQTPRIPPSRVGRCAQYLERAERTAARKKNCKNPTGALKTDTPHTGATSHQQREKDHSLPKPSPESTHPLRHAGSGMAQSGPHHAPVSGATSTQKGHPCPGRGVSRFLILLRTSMPSFDGLPRQSRRSLRFTHMLYLPHLTHDAPVVENYVPFCGRSSLPGAGSSPLSKTACHTSFWCSSSSY